MSKSDQNADAAKDPENSEIEQLREMLLAQQDQIEVLTRSQPATPQAPAKIVLATWEKKGCNSLRINNFPATEVAAVKAGYKKAA